MAGHGLSVRKSFAIHPHAHIRGRLLKKVEIDAVGFALFGYVLFAEGFEVKFAGVL